MDSIQEKCEVYKKTLFAIKNKIANNENIDKNMYENQLAEIGKDIGTENEEVQERSVELLQNLISADFQHVYPEVFRIIHSDNYPDYVHQRVLIIIKLDIKHKLGSNKFEDIMKIIELYKSYTSNQLTETIVNVCINEIPFETAKTFFLHYIVPSMMSPSTDKELRQFILDIAFGLITHISYTRLTKEESSRFQSHVTTSYIKNISELRDSGYDNWQKLWIFLVRFFGKHLHGSLDLTNKLLRVVEFAFRDSSHQQRLKGYDCWKDLIDNASLDLKHLSSSRQIKLLITPLKAKFSKQEIVILKRFDVFTFLLEKLQRNSVLVLREFLEFCFGPLGDTKDTGKGISQAKTVSALWIKSAKVLIEIIGHMHKENEICLKTDDVIKLRNPVINSRNLPHYYQIIIPSINECSILLKDVPLENRNMILKCIWKSIFYMIVFTEKETKVKCIQLITSIMDKHIMESNEYSNELLKVIFNSFLSCNEELIIGDNFLHQMLHPLMTIYLTLLNDTESDCEEKKLFERLTFKNSRDNENILDDVLDIFCKVKANENNVKYIAIAWTSLCNIMEYESYEKHINFLVWPLLNLNNLADYVDIYEKYKEVVFKYIEKSESLQLRFVKEIEKILKNNPLLCGNIIITLQMLDLSANTNTDIINIVTRMLTSILIIPSSDEDRDYLHSVARILTKYFSENPHLQKIDNDEIIKNICTCVKLVLRDKDFIILSSFNNFLRLIPSEIKAKYHKHMSLDLLMELLEDESDKKVTEQIHEIIENHFMKQIQDLKKKELPHLMPVSGRSAKIASLVQTNSRTYQRNKSTSPAALQLLGKITDNGNKSGTPVKIKGSMLNNLGTPSPPGRTKKATSSPSPSPFSVKRPSPPPLDDESSSKFVQIDTEVKLQPDKLTEKQKEALRKRREDIPALYQDLSQSTSQDLFSEKCSTADNNFHKVMEQNDVFKVPTGSKAEPSKMSKNLSIDRKEPVAENVDIISEDFNKQIHNKVVVEKLDTIVGTKLMNKNEPKGSIESDDLNRNKLQNNIDPDETMVDQNKINSVSSTEEKSRDFNGNKQNEINFLERESQEPNNSENPAPYTEKSEGKVESEKERKRRLKIEAELKKLSMDIVGAEKFTSADRRNRDKRKSIGFFKGEKEEATPKSKRRSILPMKLGEIKMDVKDISTSSLKNAPADHKALNHSEYDSDQVVEENQKTKFKENTKMTVEEKSSNNEKEDKPQMDKKEGADKIKIQLESVTAKTPKRRGRQVSCKKIEDQLDQVGQVCIDNNKLQLNENTVTNDGEPGKIDDSKTGKKRKRIKSIDEDSEDVIESSQDTTVNITPVLSLSKRKNSELSANDNNSAQRKHKRASHGPSEKTKEPRKHRRIEKLKRTKSDSSSDSSTDRSEKNTKVSPKQLLEEQPPNVKDKDSPLCKEPKRTIPLKLEPAVMKLSTPVKELQNSTKTQDEKKKKDKLSPNRKSHTSAKDKKDSPVKGTKRVLNQKSLEELNKAFTPLEEPKISTNSPDRGSGDNDSSPQPEEAKLSCSTLDSNSSTKSLTQSSSTKYKIPDIDDKSSPKAVEDIVKAANYLELTRAMGDSVVVIDRLSDEVLDSKNYKAVLDTGFHDDKDIVIEETDLVHTTQSQETETQSAKHQFTDEVMLQLDLPQKPVLTDSEKEMCQADTLTQDSVEDTTIINFESGSKINEKYGKLLKEFKSSLSPVKPSQVKISTPVTTPTGSSGHSKPVIIRVNPHKLGATPAKTEIRFEVLQSAKSVSPVTVNSIANTPEKLAATPVRPSSLPGSPVTGDTPTRTTALLKDTIDISPISSTSSSQEGNVVTSIEEILTRNHDELNKLKEYVLQTTPMPTRTSPRRLDKSPQKLEKVVPLSFSPSKEIEKANVVVKAIAPIEATPLTEKTPDVKTPQNIAERSLKFFEITKPGPAIAQQRLFLKRKSGVTMSPSTLRIKKLMSNYKIKNSDDVQPEIKEEDILTFKREVPSPLAAPKTSILKRKLCETGLDEGLSPCAKRKRVNFSDPCTTSKKIFIKDQNEVGSFIEPIAPTPQYLSDLFDCPDESDKFTETENVETEESLQVFNPLILRKDKPIYPNLVDCTDDVVLILKKVTSPMFITTLMNKLKTTNIKTIGDLAKQSEADISRLPFKVPVVANVYKALDNFYNKQYQNKAKDTVKNYQGESCEAKLRNSLATSVETKKNVDKSANNDYKPIAVIKDAGDATCSKIGDVKIVPKVKMTIIPVSKVKTLPVSIVDEFRSVLERAQLETSEKVNIRTILKEKYNILDLIEETDFKITIKHIVDTAGLPKIFEILTETIESPNDESVYFDCMLKHCIDSKPLTSLIEKRQPEEIKEALSDCIERGIMDKQGLVEKCFIPLISNPQEINTYITHLTVVEIGDLIVNRITTEEFKPFIERIKNHFGSENIITHLGIRKATVSEVKDNLMEQRSSDDVVSGFRTLICSKPQDEQVRILMEVIKTLPAATLISVQVEFLQSVLAKVSEKKDSDES